MTAVNSVADLTREGDVAVLTIYSPPVNALSANVRQGIRDGVAQAEADPAVKAIVLICGGRTFIAGADISEFGKPFTGVSLPEAQDVIENCSKPVVAAIHGTALGGGFEVALVCHYRVAVPSAKLGLPEIKLGLIPGAGGTQRLPRLIGPEAAAEAILSGTPFPAGQAKTWGVVDEIVEEGHLREGALAFARRVDRREAAAGEGARPRREGCAVPRQAGDFRGDPQGQCAQVPRLRGLDARDRSRARRGGAAVRGGAEARARGLHGVARLGAVEGAAACVLRRAAGLEDRRRCRRHADARR